MQNEAESNCMRKTWRSGLCLFWQELHYLNKAVPCPCLVGQCCIAGHSVEWQQEGRAGRNTPALYWSVSYDLACTSWVIWLWYCHKYVNKDGKREKLAGWLISLKWFFKLLLPVVSFRAQNDSVSCIEKIPFSNRHQPTPQLFCNGT